MTLRLAQIAEERWAELDGFSVSRNMPNLEDLPLDRFANFVWWYLTKDLDHTNVEKFRARLWQPPKGQRGQGPWAPNAETAAFKALQAQMAT